MAETIIYPKNPEFEGLPEYQPTLGEKDPETGEPLYPYLANIYTGLVSAVNLSIKLKRPLILEGEPGCGKTQLARAVAYEFAKKYNIKNYSYTEWTVKSTDRASDTLYVYDAIKRLYDAQLVTTDPLEKDKISEHLRDPEHNEYITWGALGKAFIASQNEQRMIVLIDEIDKGDTDFPNDLLLEIESKKFKVRERNINQEIKAMFDYAPIIFITSNAQKQLPDAFLRRCLYHYIEFPKEADLEKIIKARFGNEWSDDLTKIALKRFVKLRQLMEEEKGDLSKKVSVSELIDWIQSLKFHPTKSKTKQAITKEINQLLEKEVLPYHHTLLKTKEDLEFLDYLADDLSSTA
ncbi:AAA family ATPase [Aphanothece sacrum]|uniref:ATPase n=1 Tax=Aphanothece sacrum FPU1 TaxID=1920663 RepID=A0A401IIM8_APHSA|nr:MoxR family ATPase [Aphanothece sacrum]GBF81153.1 ATPase [Aphanothece sacrum FPU1]GBF83499.1 ATPase [Aphanothece sacrum FPU3]